MSYVTDHFDDELVRLLRTGAVGFMPSDTIYGLSCRALDKKAVEKIYKMKKRDQNKPFIILISSIEQLKDLGITTTDIARAYKYWPGKLTVVCETDEAPAWLRRSGKTLALRWPKNPGLQELINKVGPIISTSANLAGDIEVSSVTAARKIFGEQLDFYVNAGRLRRKSSTIVEPNFGTLKVIRQGSLRIRKEDR